MPIRKVTLSGLCLEVLPCDSDLEKLQISKYKRFYLALQTDQNGDEWLWKLHSFYTEKEEHKFRWIAMHNSETWTSINRISQWDTIEDALIAAKKDGWKVVQCNFDILENIVNNIKRL